MVTVYVLVLYLEVAMGFTESGFLRWVSWLCMDGFMVLLRFRCFGMCV